MKTMKAAVYRGPNEIVVEDVPIPRIGPDEYLLRVTYCGLCKTDVKKIRGVTLGTKGVLEPPRVFGHEIVGEIEKLGSHLQNSGLRGGDRVVIFHHVPCLKCYYCLRGDYVQCETYKSIDTAGGIGEPSGGGFGEFVKVPRLIAERGTIEIPDDASDKRAVFVEPTNCCYKGIKKADIELGDFVAVFGQGPIGLTLDQLAHMRGGRVIGVDLVDYRLNEAKKKYNAEYIVNAQKENFIEEIRKFSGGRGVDKSIVAVEEPKAVAQAIECTRGGGTVIFFAEFGGEQSELSNELGQLIVDNVYGKEINIRGCYSSSYPDHETTARLVFGGKIKTEEMISKICDLYHLMDAVDLADKRRHLTWEGEKILDKPRKSFKILIKP